MCYWEENIVCNQRLQPPKSLSYKRFCCQYPLINYTNLSTSDDVTSLITDEDNTLVDEPSAMEDSLIASEELQSALMLYNDSFPVGQETVIENGKKYIPFYVLKVAKSQSVFAFGSNLPNKCAKSLSKESQSALMLYSIVIAFLSAKYRNYLYLDTLDYLVYKCIV